MSNIYNRRLDYELLPSGKRVLDYPTKLTAPHYAVVGNTKPNLDFYTNRMLQPLFQTKKPISQSAFTPKQPIHAVGLGGRRPVYIDYTVPKSAPRPAVGLSWEPNTVREQRDNVYPDGVPKNASQVAQQNAQYLEKQYAEKEAQRLEGVVKNMIGGEARPLGGREDHPRELEVRRLEKMLEERKYTANPYKNVALSVDDHRKMAEKQANDIKAELAALRGESGVNRKAIVEAITGGALVKEEVRATAGEIPIGDPTIADTKLGKKNIEDANKIITDIYDKLDRGNTLALGSKAEGKKNRIDLLTALLQSKGMEPTMAQKRAEELYTEKKLVLTRAKSVFETIAALETIELPKTKFQLDEKEELAILTPLEDGPVGKGGVLTETQLQDEIDKLNDLDPTDKGDEGKIKALYKSLGADPAGKDIPKLYAALQIYLRNYKPKKGIVKL